MRLTWGCHKLDVVSGTSPAGCPVGESKTRGISTHGQHVNSGGTSFLPFMGVAPPPLVPPLLACLLFLLAVVVLSVTSRWTKVLRTNVCSNDLQRRKGVVQGEGVVHEC